MRLRIFILFVLFFKFCYAQTSYNLEQDFNITEIPTSDEDFFYLAGISVGYNFKVKIVDDKLEIQKFEPRERKDTIEFNIPNGKLIATVRGLFFEELNQSNKQEIILNRTVQNIFYYQNKICVLTILLSGIPPREGQLFTLKAQKNKFKYKAIITFNSSPYAYDIFNKKIFIASHDGFFVVKNFKINKSLRKQFWEGLYPNSIAVLDEENIFIGIRGGIVKLNILKNEITFYKYNNIVIDDMFFEIWEMIENPIVK